MIMRENRMQHTTVPPSIIKKLLDEGALLVDVRTHCEYAGYHIEGSLNVPYDEIEMMYEFLKSQTHPLITYSSHGRRSEIAVQKLKSMNVEVYNAGTIHQVELAIFGENEYDAFRHKS